MANKHGGPEKRKGRLKYSTGGPLHTRHEAHAEREVGAEAWGPSDRWEAQPTAA